MREPIFRFILVLLLAAFAGCEGKYKKLPKPDLPPASPPKSSSIIEAPGKKTSIPVKVKAKKAPALAPAKQLASQAKSSPPFDWDAGAVVVRPCPFTCNSAGIVPEQCKEWHKEDLCYVQELRQTFAAKSSVDLEQLEEILRNADKAVAEAKKADY